MEEYWAAEASRGRRVGADAPPRPDKWQHKSAGYEIALWDFPGVPDMTAWQWDSRAHKWVPVIAGSVYSPQTSLIEGDWCHRPATLIINQLRSF